MEAAFTIHITEKNAVRDLKAKIKSRNDASEVLATFDLEQVINLPKTNRCEVFYRRRLSVYNFTVYDVKSGKCDAFVWHEGMAKRGRMRYLHVSRCF